MRRRVLVPALVFMLAVFRREMGKYVDDDEVARFERYMTTGR